MKRSIIIIFVLCIVVSVGCGVEEFASTETTMATQITPTETASLNNDDYMLCSSFGFYKGSKNMSEIKSITFSRIHPSHYDECWNANLSNTEDIKGYLIDSNVVISGEYIYANPRCSYMFAAHNNYGEPLWSNLVEINGLEILDTSYAENMTMMFAFNQLTELDGISQWDVSNVKKFSGMFQGHDYAGDIKLKYLDVGKWDTSSAEDMSHIFYGCALMEYIPVENWDVSNVKTFSHMFADCHSLKNIDFSNWNTSSVESFDGFLNDCHSLVTIDVTSFNTATCKQFSQMFESCTKLEYIIGLETWDVSNASHYAFSETFHCCYKLKEVNIGDWVVSPDNTARMFKNCYSLSEIDIAGFDMTANAHMNEMFMNCDATIKR
jgi:surface protein